MTLQVAGPYTQREYEAYNSQVPHGPDVLRHLHHLPISLDRRNPQDWTSPLLVFHRLFLGSTDDRKYVIGC